MSDVWHAALFGATWCLLIGIVLLVPDAPAQAIPDKTPYLVGLGIIAAAFAVLALRAKPDRGPAFDLAIVVGLVLLGAEVGFAKLVLLDPVLFPSPARVAEVFAVDYPEMLDGLRSSLILLVAGYLAAVAAAVPIGLVIGWRRRLYRVAYPIAKTVSPIPTTVYLPYAIVLLPSFAAASIFVIFIGAFWPILVGTCYGVFGVDRRLIASARTLGLSERVMLTRIVFPAAMPSILSGAMIALILSFIILTVAEMIGASTGLGWYLVTNHQFANYDRVMAGMLLIMLVVIAVMQVFDRVQDRLLAWQQPS